MNKVTVFEFNEWVKNIKDIEIAPSTVYRTVNYIDKNGYVVASVNYENGDYYILK